MTLVLRRPVGERLQLGVLLTATAVLYLWNLSASGWANSFYSAAAQAGASDWTAMLFGASDSGNAITVDKTPGALWVMDLSVRLFGLSSWSILVPQALMGVAAVAVLYAAVRRAAGPAAALLAGAVFALTPVATLMFRFNNPDALLVLLLVVSAYCVQRACEEDAGRGWLIAAGVAAGFAFLAKMLQAFLVLPAFAAAYLVAGPSQLRTRFWRLLGGTAAMVVSGGWYLLLVELWPSSARPYVGGSQHDSIIELALGYNGVGRLNGNEPGGLGNPNFDAGWDRLLGASMGTYAGWLVPAALICLVAGLWLTRRAPRADTTRAALILWGGWLVFTAAVFSFANGIVHPYYTVALAPAIGACLGIGSVLMWRHRTALPARLTMAGAVVVTAAVVEMLLSRGGSLSWLRVAVPIIGAVAVALLLVPPRFRPARLAAVLAVAACLAAPAVYSVATAGVSHTGAMPSVGPAGGHGNWGPPPGSGKARGPAGGPAHAMGAPPQGLRPGGGLLDSPVPGAALTALLGTDAAKYRWAAAVVGSNNAAGYQLAARVPVMAVGGFNGTDPAPTLTQFEQYVATGQIHYFIDGDVKMGWGHQDQDNAGQESQQIATWVSSQFTATTVEGTVVYDLSHPRRLAAQNS
ncbi:glycosyl transferase [Mycolicibacterium aubagnense]|uniref:Glycosyl transferase n=1 Tax=Mycolicibacterium aubagnense TaxID=319707 RepID=A0ABN5YXW4_9MYCO|nr:glycosyl transferase [Mycolicibacterium aubagnense]